MKGFTILAANALLLASVACSTEPTSPVATLDQSLLSARYDGTVTSDLQGDASNPRSIQSDGLGVYQNGVSGVVSIIQQYASDWELDLTAKRSTRKVRLDFGDSLPGNPLAAPFTSATLSARFIAKATQLNPGGFAAMVGLGSTIQSPLSIAQFSYGGRSYAIRMNPTNKPGTDWVLVTCIGVADSNNPSTSSCNKWQITPTGNYDGVAKNIGYVEDVTVSTPGTFIGLFYFTFDIVISK